MDNVFDLDAWLTHCGWTGEARTQARAGFNAGWRWAADSDLGLPVEPEDFAYSAGEGYFTNGFDQGRQVYESGEYTGGVANY